jgi:MSHA biogenesis protein MshK
MVKHLKNLHKCFIMAVGMVWAATGICADSISDPTRPPAVAMPAPLVGGVATPVDAGPVLQSVMISRKKKVAVISGQEVALGKMYGDAKLVAVRDHEVDLRNPDGSLQTLQMYAGVTKTGIEAKRKTPAKAVGTKQP